MTRAAISLELQSMGSNFSFGNTTVLDVVRRLHEPLEGFQTGRARSHGRRGRRTDLVRPSRRHGGAGVGPQHSSKQVRGVLQRQSVVSFQALLSTHLGFWTSVTHEKQTGSAMQAATKFPHIAPVHAMQSLETRVGVPGVTTGGTKKHNVGQTPRHAGSTQPQLRRGRGLLERVHASPSGSVRHSMQSGSPLHDVHSGSHCAARHSSRRCSRSRVASWENRPRPA